MRFAWVFNIIDRRLIFFDNLNSFVSLFKQLSSVIFVFLKSKIMFFDCLSAALKECCIVLLLLPTGTFISQKIPSMEMSDVRIPFVRIGVKNSTSLPSLLKNLDVSGSLASGKTL